MDRSTMSALEGVVAHIAEYADTEVISLPDLEKLFVQVATALNKAGMRAAAKESAARAFEGGMETYGDLRSVTAVWFEDRAGMGEFDAVALARVRQPHDFRSSLLNNRRLNVLGGT